MVDVRQVQRCSEFGVGVRPGPEDRAPARRREAGSVGAGALDMVQEPGELDGERDPEVGGVASGTVVRDAHGLLDEVDNSRRLSCGRTLGMSGCFCEIGMRGPMRCGN